MADATTPEGVGCPHLVGQKLARGATRVSEPNRASWCRDPAISPGCDARNVRQNKRIREAFYDGLMEPYGPACPWS